MTAMDTATSIPRGQTGDSHVSSINQCLANSKVPRALKTAETDVDQSRLRLISFDSQLVKMAPL